MRDMTIGVLARSAGVNLETIRYYQRRGLIATPRKPPGGIRRYPHTALAQMRFIKRAQQLGFSLNEIRELLALGEQSCSATRRFAERRLADIEARLKDLKTIRRLLTHLIRECAAGRTAVCPIVQSLNSARESA